MVYTNNLDQTDGSFIRDLRDSKEAVGVAARWLNDKGYPVIVRPTFERPTAEKMSEFSDDGDLEIIQRVEVKRRSLKFTSRESYPFKTVIVDVAHAWDKAKPKPYAYIIFNQEMTGCLIVKGETFPNWTKTTKYDNARNRERTFYECPISLAKFEGLE